MKTKEGWPKKVPYQISTEESLEDALLHVTDPIKAIAEALPWGKIQEPIENLSALKGTLQNFLEQLWFLVSHSEIDGSPILFAKINYPFKITYKNKEEQRDDK